MGRIMNKRLEELGGVWETTGEKEAAGKFQSKCSKRGNREEAAAISKGKVTDSTHSTEPEQIHGESRAFPEPQSQAQREAGCGKSWVSPAPSLRGSEQYHPGPSVAHHSPAPPELSPPAQNKNRFLFSS